MKRVGKLDHEFEFEYCCRDCGPIYVGTGRKLMGQHSECGRWRREDKPSNRARGNIGVNHALRTIPPSIKVRGFAAALDVAFQFVVAQHFTFNDFIIDKVVNAVPREFQKLVQRGVRKHQLRGRFNCPCKVRFEKTESGVLAHG
jgi:hypothetical protein